MGLYPVRRRGGGEIDRRGGATGYTGARHPRVRPRAAHPPSGSRGPASSPSSVLWCARAALSGTGPAVSPCMLHVAGGVIIQREVFDMDRQVRAVLYCRSHRRSVHALEAQENRCRQRAMEVGATSTTTIFDEDAGTADIGRPGIVKLRRLLYAGAVDLVVADTADRLTKRIADLRTIKREVSAAGARLVLVSP